MKVCTKQLSGANRRLIWIAVLSIVAAGGNVTKAAAEGAPSRDSLRLDLKKTAVSLFTSSSNHCEAFAKVVEAAVSKADDAGTLLEDLKLVLVGEDWLRRTGKRGKFYMGIKTTDSGFKKELQDSSPQVEHAMAAIYLAKADIPGGIGAKGTFFEFAEAAKNGTKPDAADIKLWMYGEDLGDRLATNNMKQFPTALRKTLCE